MNLIFILLPAIYLWGAETAGVQVQAGKTEVLLAEPVEVVYRIPLGDGENLDLSGWKAGATQWENVSLWDFKSERKGDAVELRVTVMPFVLGKAEIPDLKIPVINNFQTKFINTPPVTLQVADPTAMGQGNPQLKDIKSPRRPLYFWEHPLGIALLSLSALLVAFGLAMLWWSKRKKQSGEKLSEEKNLTPEEAFYRKLAQLEQSGMLETGQIREFYFGVSAAWRQYLDRRYSLESEALTSSELVRLLNARREALEIQASETVKLRECFELMDLAKFAKYQPEREEQHRIIQTLQNFVEMHARKPALSAVEGSGVEG